MKSRLLALLILLALLGFFVALPFLKTAAVYVTVVAIGLAVALQKYLASYAGYFVIRFSHIFDVGNRIRIGNIKGDVRSIGLLHFVLDEVGEDEKLGGELTGRLLHIPNLIVLDQPVLNYSKNYSIKGKVLQADYIFDEIRIPLAPKSDVLRASRILEEILLTHDQKFQEEAKALFRDDYPNFLAEAESSPRVLVNIEPQRIWLKGKFVTPIRVRNELRTAMHLKFLQEIEKIPEIQLA